MVEDLAHTGNKSLFFVIFWGPFSQWKVPLERKKLFDCSAYDLYIAESTFKRDFRIIEHILLCESLFRSRLTSSSNNSDDGCWQYRPAGRLPAQVTHIALALHSVSSTHTHEWEYAIALQYRSINQCLYVSLS